MAPSARARLALEQIRTLTPRINAASDRAAKIVRRVEAFLQESGAAGPVEAGEVGSGDETWMLAYTRVADKQRIVIRHARIRRDEQGAPIDLDDFGLPRFHTVSESPWGDASRGLRLRTFALLPDLLGQLAERAEEDAERADEAAAAIEELLAANGSDSDGDVGERRSTRAEIVEECVRADPRWHVFYRSGGYVDFVPHDWTDWMPPAGLDNAAHPQSWFVLRFDANHQGHLDFYAEVRRMESPALRHKIITFLLEKGRQYGLVRKQENVTIKDQFTRVNSREKVLVWLRGEPTSKEVDMAIKQKLDDLYPKLAMLAAALQPLIESSGASSSSAAR